MIISILISLRTRGWKYFEILIFWIHLSIGFCGFESILGLSAVSGVFWLLLMGDCAVNNVFFDG